MAEPLKKDEALAAAVREAFQRHMEAARQASQALKDKQAVPPSASLAPSTSSIVAQRDSRLTLPKPANEARAVPLAAVKVSTEGVSLDRLLAIASPQKVADPATEAPHFLKIPVTAPSHETRARSTVEAEIEGKPVPIVEVPNDGGDIGSTAQPVVEMIPRPSATAALGEDVTESGLDFGEALFFEIVSDDDKSADGPKMPRAASLEASPQEPATESGLDNLEFRQPPSRERPRMSTANPAASSPQDLDLSSKSRHLSTPLLVEPASHPAKDEIVVDLPKKPVPSKFPTRFGVAASAKPSTSKLITTGPTPANGNKAHSKFKIPTALIASLLVGAVIVGGVGYVWSHPGQLEALSVLVAPPAPETQEASSAPDVPAPQPDGKITGPLPAKEVSTAPARPASSLTSISVPTSAAPEATRSVSTLAITLDAVDEAVQSAHELASNGDVEGARQALDSYKTGSDPRALFALAETYDPAIVKDPSKADPAQAKSFYEAAAKAGSRDNTADRIARLALLTRGN